MTLRKKKTPRASQHYMGWRAGQKSLLLPVAGAFFPLTLPFIERGYRPCGFSLFRLRLYGQVTADVRGGAARRWDSFRVRDKRGVGDLQLT